jgi:hypothetical protein
MAPVKQEYVGVRISQMEPVTVTAMNWMYAVYAAALASQMVNVSALALLLTVLVTVAVVLKWMNATCVVAITIV